MRNDEKGKRGKQNELSNCNFVKTVLMLVGLSMMCYTFGKEKRMCFGDIQLSGLMGKLLY